jgi:hypothetical protein
MRDPTLAPSTAAIVPPPVVFGQLLRRPPLWILTRQDQLQDEAHATLCRGDLPSPRLRKAQIILYTAPSPPPPPPTLTQSMMASAPCALRARGRVSHCPPQQSACDRGDPPCALCSHRIPRAAQTCVSPRRVSKRDNTPNTQQSRISVFQSAKTKRLNQLLKGWVTAIRSTHSPMKQQTTHDGRTNSSTTQ